MANTNRTKGHAGEQLYAKLFRELGYTFCKTSRQASRLLDDAGIDLAFIPFNVQLKTGFHKGLNPVKLLANMREKIVELFPPEDNVHQNPCIVIHRNQIGRGHKRVAEDDLVFMLGSTFDEINNKHGAGPISYHVLDAKQKRGWTYKSILLDNKKENVIKVICHTYKKLVIMSFEDFKKIINK